MHKPIRSHFGCIYVCVCVCVCVTQEEEKKRKEAEKKAKENANRNNEEIIIKHGGVMGDMPEPEKRPAGKSQLWCISGCFEA